MPRLLSLRGTPRQDPHGVVCSLPQSFLCPSTCPCPSRRDSCFTRPCSASGQNIRLALTYRNSRRLFHPATPTARAGNSRKTAKRRRESRGSAPAHRSSGLCEPACPETSGALIPPMREKTATARMPPGVQLYAIAGHYRTRTTGRGQRTTAPSPAGNRPGPPPPVDARTPVRPSHQ